MKGVARGLCPLCGADGFLVNADLQVFICFGCGAEGDWKNLRERLCAAESVPAPYVVVPPDGQLRLPNGTRMTTGR